MQYVVIGVDCSVKAADVGLARVRGSPGTWSLEAVDQGSARRLPEQIVAEWIHEESSAVLLALDAPLGWPIAMSEHLRQHSAGASLKIEANELFRRDTDRFIVNAFRKTPLSVGADKLARTAHWAVNFLDELRKRLKIPIPLAWTTPLEERVSAIEVYPAATLLSHGASLERYKTAAGARERVALYEVLQKRFSCAVECASAVASPHLIDAIVCALGGTDFLDGSAVAPEDYVTAKREGWIWARPRT